MKYLRNSKVTKRQLGIELEINKLCTLVQKFIFSLANPAITVENVIQTLIDDRDFRDVYPEEYFEALVQGFDVDEQLSDIFTLYWGASDKFWIEQQQWVDEILAYLAEKREKIEKIKNFLNQFDINIVESAIAQYDNEN